MIFVFLEFEDKNGGSFIVNMPTIQIIEDYGIWVSGVYKETKLTKQETAEYINRALKQANNQSRLVIPQN